jgi:S1-C subfamily serine protease
MCLSPSTRHVSFAARHVLPGLILLSLSAASAVAASPEDSVVRVFATLRLPNPTRPWAKQNPVEVMGSGVVIDGKQILTNAHVVSYASEVKVQGRQGGDRFDARVATIGPGIDLATLTLEDETFFEKRPPIPRAAKRPGPNSVVALLGFPMGGNNLAVTRGVVSRIDYASFKGFTAGLRIQVDATVSQGNSGGPALVDGKMVGLTFSRLAAAQNGGYVIPNEEIDLYLEDVKDGRYDGKLRISDYYQALENEALRAKLGLAKSVRGIMVRKLGAHDPAYPLREGDVVTRIGAAAIDNEGAVEFEENLRLPFTSLLTRLAKGSTVPVSLIRKGKPVDVALPVTRQDDRLIKPYNGQYPPYFVHGPLVFSPVLEEAAGYYFQGNPAATMGSPVVTRDGDREAFPGEELVVATAPLMQHKISRGYADPFGLVVCEVDGVKIKNLRHLVEVLRDGHGEFLTIRFFGEYSEVLVFRRKAIEEVKADLMSENGISRRGSSELMAVWNTKPGLQARQ